MDKLSRKKEGKKEVRSKRLLTEAFFDLLNDCPDKPITVKDLCDKADYARPTFYAHFNQIQDVPYEYYKKYWLVKYIEQFASLNNQKNLSKREILQHLIISNFEYWTSQVKIYKLLKSKEMDMVLLKLFEEATQSIYKKIHPTPDSFVNSMFGKCLIKGHAQLALSIYDIWTYSGRSMDTKEMASIILKIIDGTSSLGNDYEEKFH